MNGAGQRRSCPSHSSQPPGYELCEVQKEYTIPINKRRSALSRLSQSNARSAIFAALNEASAGALVFRQAAENRPPLHRKPKRGERRDCVSNLSASAPGSSTGLLKFILPEVSQPGRPDRRGHRSKQPCPVCRSATLRESNRCRSFC